MTGRSNEAEIKPKINCAKKKKTSLSDRVDFFATTVQEKKTEQAKVINRGNPIPVIWLITDYPVIKRLPIN